LKTKQDNHYWAECRSW